MKNVYRFTVEFDQEVWASLSDAERGQWINDTWDAINTEAYCSGMEPVK